MINLKEIYSLVRIFFDNMKMSMVLCFLLLCFQLPLNIRAFSQGNLLVLRVGALDGSSAVEGDPSSTSITVPINENNKTYYFRVYGINILGYISNGFAAGNVLYNNNDLSDYSNFITLKDFK